MSSKALEWKKTSKQLKKKIVCMTDRQTDGWTDWQIDKQTYGQNRFIKYGIASTVKIVKTYN